MLVNSKQKYTKESIRYDIHFHMWPVQVARFDVLSKGYSLGFNIFAWNVSSCSIVYVVVGKLAVFPVAINMYLYSSIAKVSFSSL